MIRVSFFGKLGDLMYALPAVRALSRKHCCKITLLVSGHCYQFAPLLQEQPYIADVELEDTKAHDLVPIERGAVANHWRWFNPEDEQNYNLSLQPLFFADEAPISWTHCYMQAAGLKHLTNGDCVALPSLVNHRRWMQGIDIELNGARQQKPRTMILAPETDTLDELMPQQWQQVANRVLDAGYQPIIVGTRLRFLLEHCTDLRGRTTVPVLARLISDASGFIGAHSFPWHLARHSETPAVCLQTWREGLRRCLPIDTPYTWLTPEEWELAVPSVLGLTTPKEGALCGPTNS